MSRNRANAAKFSRDLVGEATGELERRGRLVLGKSVLEALRVVVERSPVDTSALRNNWQVGLVPEAPILDDRGGEEGQPPSIEQFSKADETLQRAPTFGKLYIVNPMPYAEFVDQGTPQMTARPMVDPAIEVAKAVIRQAGLES